MSDRLPAAAALAAAALAAGRPCRGRGGSTSMRPLLAPGDWVLVEPADRPPRRGDLIAVARGDGVIVHRVVARGAGGCWTKGDAVLALDPFVPDGEVLGTVTALETASGRRIALTGARWRLVHWLLGCCGWWAARCCPRLRPRWLAGLGWRLLRAPFHLAARWARR